MSERKTIQINPAFLSTNKIKNTTLKNNIKREKHETPATTFKPNYIKKQLLQRIKNKQKEVEDTIVVDTMSENTEPEDDKEFNDEFNKSLGFLQDLASKQEHREIRNKTLKKPKSFLNVNTELPNDFDIPLSEVPDIVQSFNVPTTEVVAVPPLIQKKPNTFTLKSRPPYGNLKMGTVPTYRQWKNTISHKPNIEPLPTIRIEDKPEIKETQRSKELEQLKQHYKASQYPATVAHTQVPVVQDKRYKKFRRITKTFRYKLGKTGDKVSVLIKNNNSRKKVQHEHALLKKKTIMEIKNYLREKNLLKTGSDAPNDVLRQMYEQSILSGDLNNTSKNTLIHNFLHN